MPPPKAQTRNISRKGMKKRRQARISSEVVVIRRFVIDLLDPVHELFRLPRDLKGHGRQAVVEIFQLAGIVDGRALGICVEEPASAVGKRAHDRFRSITKRIIPGFVDGRLGG